MNWKSVNGITITRQDCLFLAARLIPGSSGYFITLTLNHGKPTVVLMCLHRWQFLQFLVIMVSPPSRCVGVLREAYLFQLWLLAHLVSVCQWGVCVPCLCAQSQPLSAAAWRRGREASGCGTWDGMFPSCSYPRWSTLSEKPLERPVPLCIQSVFPRCRTTTGYFSRGQSPTWSWRLRRFWGLKCRASCEDWRRTRTRDEDSAGRVLEASSDETQRGSFRPGAGGSAGRAEGGATQPWRADADCSVGEAPRSRCWEIREDTGIPRRRPRTRYLVLRARTERDRRSCSTLSCWFSWCASGLYFLQWALYSLWAPAAHPACYLNQWSPSLKTMLFWSY